MLIPGFGSVWHIPGARRTRVIHLEGPVCFVRLAAVQFASDVKPSPTACSRHLQAPRHRARRAIELSTWGFFVPVTCVVSAVRFRGQALFSSSSRVRFSSTRRELPSIQIFSVSMVGLLISGLDTVWQIPGARKARVIHLGPLFVAVKRVAFAVRFRGQAFVRFSSTRLGELFREPRHSAQRKRDHDELPLKS